MNLVEILLLLVNKNIKTKTRKDTKEGMWIKCPDCGEVVYSNMLATTYYMCPSCSHHFNFSGKKYIDLLFSGVLLFSVEIFKILSDGKRATFF